MRRKLTQIATTMGVVAMTLVGFAGCESFGPLGAGAFGTVVVDAGHGGHNRGAKPRSGDYEKVITLDTANRLAKNLRRRGFRVIITRSKDEFVSLDQRVDVSNRTRNCIFVSVHYNWAPYASAHGVETFYYTERARRLAANVQKELVGAYGASNRGVKQRGFYVLRKNERPAILVECGFVSNPSENSVAQSGSGRQKIADAIARGIVSERKGRNPYSSR